MKHILVEYVDLKDVRNKHFDSKSVLIFVVKDNLSASSYKL